MATSHQEIFIDRRDIYNADSPRVDIKYQVLEAADRDALFAYVAANISDYVDFFNGALRLKKTTVQVDEETSEDANWIITVTYTLPTIDDGGSPTPGKSFTTAGGTQHITQSKSTTNSYPAGAPDLEQAIGFDGQNVQGADIVVPIFDFQQTEFETDATVDSAFITTLRGLTGNVNSDTITSSPFGSFAAGELLYLGADGVQSKPGGDWEITHRFSYSPNQTGLSVGSITSITKSGWDYLWVRYEESTDSDDVVKVPAYVYVERVYDTGALLGLSLTGWS